MKGDRKILACRPVDWTYMAEHGPDLPELPVYPGSVAQACTRCGVQVWVGPRQQASGMAAYCIICALEYAAERGGSTVVRNLGNPYLPREATDDQSHQRNR